MNAIVSEEDFYNSFSKYQKHKLQDYNEVIRLSKIIENKLEISRRTRVPKSTVQNWISNSSKPIGVIQLEKLKSIGLLPLIESNDDKFLFFVELFAFLFGDGHLNKKFSVSNFCGEIKDLIKIKQMLKKLFGIHSNILSNKSFGKTIKIKNGVKEEKQIYGINNTLWLSSPSLNRLFFLAGAINGDKVKSNVLLPQWIMESDLVVKQKFLGVIFGNELQCPYLRTKGAFSSPQFGLHKVENKISSLNLFLSQIKELLLEFGVESSEIKIEKYKTLRSKDKLLSSKSFFFIYSNPKNILRLFYSVPFIYASNKQEKFEFSVNKFLKINSGLKFDWGVYEKAMLLHKQGLGHVRIFKKLKLPKSYLYKLNYWIYYDKKPKYYASKKEIKYICSLIE